MKPEDVPVLESILQRIADALGAALRETEFAIQVLAARGRRSPRVPSRHRILADLVDDGGFAVRWHEGGGPSCPIEGSSCKSVHLTSKVVALSDLLRAVGAQRGE
jgi:hypothetical protein